MLPCVFRENKTSVKLLCIFFKLLSFHHRQEKYKRRDPWNKLFYQKIHSHSKKKITHIPIWKVSRLKRWWQVEVEEIRPNNENYSIVLIMDFFIFFNVITSIVSHYVDDVSFFRKRVYGISTWVLPNKCNLNVSWFSNYLNKCKWIQPFAS